MKHVAAICAFPISLLLAFPAYADRIDGGWCDGKGGHMHVDGAKITTPSGKVLSGDYDRHSFHYVGPEGDGDAGIDVFGMLRSEEEMTLYRGRDANRADGETWRRCDVTS